MSAKAENEKVYRAGRNSLSGCSFAVPVQCVSGGVKVAAGRIWPQRHNSAIIVHLTYVSKVQ